MAARRDAAAGPAPMVSRPVPADWLSLRRQADHTAREAALPLVAEAVAALGAEDAPVRVIDVGAGTGSNQAWLADRLVPLEQHWILVDHDADLIDAVDPVAPTSVSSLTRRIATVAELPDIVAEDEGPVLFTCAALLDLLSPADAAVLVDAIARTGSAALLSLSVTGAVSIDPPHPADTAITDAFDAHQRRDDLLGPDAVDHVAGLLRERGQRVRVAETPWRLDAAEQAALVQRYLHDRADVAIEHDPALADLVTAWREERQAQIDRGALVVHVGHADILSLPASA
ncbi:hypothetical protein [Microbacterium aurantiacum]|uniref:hypothetical protein n=1 Tax=Microbacterium aurantiacum TaxID=162393 RepID=UPI003F499BFE